MKNNNNMAKNPDFHISPLSAFLTKTHISYRTAAKHHYRRNDTIQCYQFSCIVEFVERELNKNEIAKRHKSVELRMNTNVSTYCKKAKTGKMRPPGFAFFYVPYHVKLRMLPGHHGRSYYKAKIQQCDHGNALNRCAAPTQRGCFPFQYGVGHGGTPPV